MAQRDLYIDRLRSVMTALVILHHTAITYGGSGGWFYREVETSGAPSSILLTLFCATNQAYFMGFFFLLAGYFTPAALERKGHARFIAERFLRLGLPLLVFGFFLGPLTVAIVNYAQGDGFWPVFGYLWHHKQFINGPLWFAQALLIFSLAYCAWRVAFGAPLKDTQRVPKPIPRPLGWLLSACAVGMAALAIRQFVPTGVNVFGLQLGYFASYIYLFAIGIAAWRSDWFRQLSWKTARAGVVAVAIAWPCLPLSIVLAKAVGGAGKSNFSGGLSWTAILYALWEPFVAWGMIAAWLLIFRQRMNQPSRFCAWLNRRAYAVYIVHPPILVGMALLLRGWSAPALIKFSATGLLTCVACWLVADPLVRLPGLRRVV
jgi:peptidoglycan/LPS O-acetylase OafA/YrhL